MIRHQFGQVEFASEQWFRLAAATLASSTHVAGIATAAKPPSCRVRRIHLVAAGNRMASLVVVLAEGPVKQVLLAADPVPDGDTLEALSGELRATADRSLCRRRAACPRGARRPGATVRSPCWCGPPSAPSA